MNWHRDGQRHQKSLAEQSVVARLGKRWAMATFDDKLHFTLIALMGAFFGLAIVGSVAYAMDWPERETWDVVGGVTGTCAVAALKFLHIV